MKTYPTHHQKSKIILSHLTPILSKNNRTTISIFGGSGSGKSGTALLLADALTKKGINTYLVNGDNYPHRIPKHNDAERLRVFNESGDAGLRAYLGTTQEVDFEEVKQLMQSFKNGDDKLSIKKMGREEDDIHYQLADVKDVSVLLLEWTHGGNDYLDDVTDIHIFLQSTTKETEKFRVARGRDKGADSPFVTRVLNIEESLLNSQSHKAKINIPYKYDDVQAKGVMLNAYPDSVGGNLANCAKWLQDPALADTFSNFYILPSMFNSDLDRGFSVVDYGLNGEIATQADLENLKEMGISLKLDFVLNHLSMKSGRFDLFIDWNSFWQEYGTKTSEGYVEPHEQYIKDMHFRKPGLPVMMVDGKAYWNTFYQDQHSAQLDLDVQSPLVWDFYEETLAKLAHYGAQIVRLDAFAYSAKRVGSRNFLNEETWDILAKIRTMADKHSLSLLPEIHAEYREKVHEKLASLGYITYDFFLPGLIIHAIEKQTAQYLARWINDIQEKNLQVVNMLGCHDGIPMLDLRGLLPESEIDEVIAAIVKRGGYVKDLESKSETQKKMYYQVNATYYSALGDNDEDCDKKMLLARAIQIFMPGMPQVWYLDLVGGKNDHDAVAKAGAGGHKEINRTNLSLQHMQESAKTSDLVVKQLELLRFRNTHPAFLPGAKLTVKTPVPDGHLLTFKWQNGEHTAQLEVDFKSFDYNITKEV